MKRGFTLIELLAVIVILAIIALIATPIILGIINDARKESNERCAELYASSVKNAIAAYQLTHPNTPTSFSDLDVQYDGNIECSTEELYADGSFYITDCTVNGSEVDYTYGEKQVMQVYKPQYYLFEIDFSGTIDETALPTNPSTEPPTSEIRYLGYDVTNGVVSAAYSCFVRNETEYCLKGDAADYEINKVILEDAFKDMENACSFGADTFSCSANGLSAYADLYGAVGATVSDVFCDVQDYGGFGCAEV